MKYPLSAFLAALLLLAPTAHAQEGGAPSTETNIEIFEPPNLPMANDYRAGSGRPGADYWQNEADYDIQVQLDESAHRITGTETITYTNNSPQELDYLWVQLDQNLFSPESRGARITTSEERFSGAFGAGGYQISNLRLVRDGEVVEPEYLIEDTEMRITLDEPLADQGGTLKLKLDYTFTIPEYGADRMGRLETEQGTVYELAQWYPRMFVFDDVSGWNVMPYLGQGEYYLEYGTFEVALTVPRDMIVAATGQLQNPGEVLTADQQRALDEARQSDETVTIIGREDVGTPASRPEGEGMLTWRYRAENVRDFSWAASSAFLWDAARAETGDGSPALAQSFYPEEGIGTGETVGWERSTQMVQHSIEFYSDLIAPYPYPVAINVAGIVAGMEYPQIVFCSVEARGQGLFGVTDHEFGHEWFPMIVGSDERRHAWMDEGLNTFMNHYSRLAYYDAGPAQARARQGFLGAIAEQMVDYAADQPIMTLSDRIIGQNLGFLAYTKPAAGLILLREYVLGPELFDPAFQAYFHRWAYKHPHPADFFRTIEDVAGEDLDWFWNGWFYGTPNLNPALASVTVENGTTRVVVEQRTQMVMPLELAVTYEDGSTEQVRVPVEAFFTTDEHTVVLPGAAERVVLDPTNTLPDTDASADVWTAEEGLASGQ